EMVTMNRMQWLSFFMKHLDLLHSGGEAVEKISEATNTVERWEAVKPFGDELAPAVDEFLAMAAEESKGSVSVMSSESDLEQQLLNTYKTELQSRVTAQDYEAHAQAFN